MRCSRSSAAARSPAACPAWNRSSADTAPSAPTAAVSAQEQSALYGARLPIPTVTPYRPDPREACQYPQPCFFNASLLPLSIRGGFDLTDELMRLGGQDPYRYAKAQFLAGTRELRIRMAARAHADEFATP